MRIHPEVKYYAIGLFVIAVVIFTVVKIIQSI